MRWALLLLAGCMPAEAAPGIIAYGQPSPIDVLPISHSLLAGDLQSGSFYPHVQRIMRAIRNGGTERGFTNSDADIRFSAGDLFTNQSWLGRRMWGHVDPGTTATEANGEVSAIVTAIAGDPNSYNPDIVWIYHGENDISIDGDTPAQALADVQALCVTAQAAWPSATMLVTIPFDSATGTGDIQTLQGLIAGGGVTCADQLLDLSGYARTAGFDGGADTVHPDVRALPGNEATWLESSLDFQEYGTEALAFLALEAIYGRHLTLLAGESHP